MTGRRWTAKEDEIVRTYPTKAAAYLLRHSRTWGAVRDRRRKFAGTMARACWVKCPWTEAEDEIVRSNPIKVAVALLKGSRTETAVRLRRGTIGVAAPVHHWTKVEDRRIRRTARLPLKKAVRLFKDRTATAIIARRNDLGCQQKRGPKNDWKGSEVKLLREMWPDRRLSDIAAAIPRHSVEGLRGMAARLGIHKTQTFGAVELLDQLRARAYEDGISQVRLAAELGFGRSWLRGRRNVRHDFNKVAAAVAFFGGRLVIDWQDE